MADAAASGNLVKELHGLAAFNGLQSILAALRLAPSLQPS